MKLKCLLLFLVGTFAFCSFAENPSCSSTFQEDNSAYEKLAKKAKTTAIVTGVTAGVSTLFLVTGVEVDSATDLFGLMALGSGVGLLAGNGYFAMTHTPYAMNNKEYEALSKRVDNYQSWSQAIALGLAGGSYFLAPADWPWFMGLIPGIALSSSIGRIAFLIANNPNSSLAQSQYEEEKSNEEITQPENKPAPGILL